MKKNNIRPFIVCLVSALFYFFQNIQGNMFNSLSASLIKEFAISVEMISVLSASYFYSNVLFIFAAGIIIDYFSRKKLLLLACGINVMSVLGFSLATAPWQIFICHFISGLTGTFSLIACLRLATNWFSRDYLATISGMIVMVGAIGGIVAQTPFIFAIDSFGWRITLQLSAVYGAVAFILIFFLVDECPDPTHKLKLPDFEFKRLRQTLSKVLSNHFNWLLGICGAIMNAPVFILGALWGNTFLTQIYGINSATAATICSMIAVGGAGASFALSALSDHLGKRRIVVQGVIILAFFIMALLFFAKISHIFWLFAIFLLLGITASIQPVLYTWTAECNEEKYLSSAQGLMMTLMMAGGFSQNVFSSLLELKWDHTIKNHMPIFSLENYQQASIVILGGYLLAFTITWFIKDQKKT